MGPRVCTMVGTTEQAANHRHPRLAGQRRNVGQSDPTPACHDISPLHRFAGTWPIDALPNRHVVLHILGRHCPTETDRSALQMEKDLVDGTLSRRCSLFHVRGLFSR